MSKSAPVILALSSGGGHWVQLLRLRPAFDGCRTVYACGAKQGRCDVPDSEFHAVPEANRWRRLDLLRCAAAITGVIAKVKPDVVVTTGAAPGCIAAWIGRLSGARVLWVDSAANAERLSLSALLARPAADFTLTQWPHLARNGGPVFRGSVL
jgi:hypothetical protein